MRNIRREFRARTRAVATLLLAWTVVILVAVRPPHAVAQTIPDSSAPAPAGAAATHPPHDADALFAEGAARLAAGDTHAACTLFARAVARRPDRSDFVLALARAYALTGRADEGRRLLENLAARAPENCEIRRALAALLVDARRFSDAAAHLGACERELDVAGVGLFVRALRGMNEAARLDDLLERSIERLPDAIALWCAWLDTALDAGKPAVALRRFERYSRGHAAAPALCYRAACAYFALGELLGRTEVREFADASPGQFVADRLLVERRDGAERFLCSPPQSALFQVRLALDGGFDDPAAVLLHARIWQGIGRPETAFAIARSCEAALLESGDAATILALMALAREAGAVADQLRYARAAAARRPAERERILFDAYEHAAEQCNQRGDTDLYLGFLRRACRLRSRDVPMLLKLADAEWRADHRAAAAERYERILAMDPAAAARSEALERVVEFRQQADASAGLPEEKRPPPP